MIRAVIMAGGKGTRLLPLTNRMPKPMLPLLDRPAVEYAVELLVHYGIRDITMTVSYMAQTIMEYFQQGEDLGAHLDYSYEKTPLGTAGSVKFIDPSFTDTFLVMSGDGLTDVNLKEAIALHKSNRALATIVVKRVACPRGFGVVVTNERGQIEHFVEKPQTWVEGLTYLVNTGIYIFEPEVLDYIPKGKFYDFGKDVFPALLKDGAPLFTYELSGYWSDIGTLRQYYQSQLDMLCGNVQVNLPAEVAREA